jgi:hypothetical protein
LEDVSVLVEGIDQNERTCLLVDASSPCSGITLRLLGALSGATDVFVFVRADGYLTKVNAVIKQVTTMILQEYARSGLISNLFLVSEEKCEHVLHNLTLKNRKKLIGDFLASILHNYYFSEFASKFEDNKEEYSAQCRIGTIRFKSLSSGDIFRAYDLKNEEGRVVYPVEANMTFLLTLEDMEDGDVNKKIKSLLGTRKSLYTLLGYAIIETNATQVVIVEKTSMIQQIRSNE